MKFHIHFAEAGEGWAKWTPDIPERGTYNVYIRWVTEGFSTRSPMADIIWLEIGSAGGTDCRTVDQMRYGGNWIFLGTYEMAEGKGNFV